MRELDKAEVEVLCALGQVWNLFGTLPVLHHDDRQEMLRAIHAAQNIVFARPAQQSFDCAEELNEEQIMEMIAEPQSQV